MRRVILIVLAALAVLVPVGLYGAQTYAERRAVAEVDKLLAGLQSQGATTASRGPVTFSLWSRTLRVTDIAITMPNGMGAKVGGVTVSGIDLLASDFTTRGVEATGIDLTAKGAAPAFTATATLPRLSAADVRIARDARAPAAATLAATPTADPQLARLLAGVDIGRIDSGPIAAKVQMPGTPGETMVGVGSVTLLGLIAGRLDEIAVDKISVSGTGPAMAAERLALQALEVPAVVAVASTIATAKGPPDADTLRRLMMLVGGFEVRGIDMAALTVGPPIRIGRLAASWGRIVDGVPTRVKFAGQGTVPLDASRPEHKLLIDRGIAAMALSGDVGMAWTEAAKSLEIEPGTVEIERMGRLTVTGKLGNVTRSAWGLDLGKMQAAMPGFEVGPLAVSVKDTGFLAAGTGADRTEAIANFTLLKQQVASTPTPSASLIALLDALTTFMAADGRTLDIRLTPKEVVRVGEVLAALGTPETMSALVDRFTVEAKVVP